MQNDSDKSDDVERQTGRKPEVGLGGGNTDSRSGRVATRA